MPRAHLDIDQAIISAEAKLRSLHAEKLRRDRNDEMIADFKSGMDIIAISKARRLGYSAVQGILYRAGLTIGGRTAIKKQLRDPGAHDGAAA